MSLDKKVVLNATYMVKTKWNEWVEGQLFAKRLREKDNQIEYFVHYDTLDRKFDEWVDIDQIDLLTFKDPYEDPDIKLLKSELENIDKNVAMHLTRDQMKKRLSFRTKIDNLNDRSNKSEVIFDTLEKEFKEFTKIKYITKVQLGNYLINTWYFSPYPNAFGKLSKIFVCNICLKYFDIKDLFRNHIKSCFDKIPQGNLLYKDDQLQLFEVNGESHKLYSQCLCLLGKMFINQKTVYYDVDSFKFFTLYEVTALGSQRLVKKLKKQTIINEEYQLVGYFSKEKDSEECNNLACIVVFPPFQKKGYGNFLIQISYELSRKEGIIGQPEKPLSFMGHRSYTWFWRWKILGVLLLALNSSSTKPIDYYSADNNNNCTKQKTIIKTLSTNNKFPKKTKNSSSPKAKKTTSQIDQHQDIPDPPTIISIDFVRFQTGITKEDILHTLDDLNLLQYWLNDGLSVMVPSPLLMDLINDPNVFREPKIIVKPDKFLSYQQN